LPKSSSLVHVTSNQHDVGVEPKVLKLIGHPLLVGNRYNSKGWVKSLSDRLIRKLEPLVKEMFTHRLIRPMK
jgi:hypothetical protein